MIELQHIQKVFNKGKVNEVIALNDVSLTIQKEDFLVVVGSNGSGKTTLLNIIAGAEFNSSGKVLINNKDVSRLPEYKRSRWIARVFQNPLIGTASGLSILDNFRLAAIRTKHKNLTIGINEAFKKQVKEQIATLGMGLENKLEQAIGTLSGGQRQALTLLMSVMSARMPARQYHSGGNTHSDGDNAQILLLDEPTAALDPRSAALIMETADKLIEQYKLTAILITHNLKEAYQYGNRLIQMSEGKVLRDLKESEKKTLQLQGMFEWFS